MHPIAVAAAVIAMVIHTYFFLLESVWFMPPGRALVFFACASMVAAGVVLVVHNAAFLRAALIQAIPPAIAIVVAWLVP